MKEAVSGMQQKKDSSGGRDTSRFKPNSKPSSPCCHSTLQRTLLRKSDSRVPMPSGGCSPECLRSAENGEFFLIVGIRFLLGGAGANHCLLLISGETELIRFPFSVLRQG